MRLNRIHIIGAPGSGKTYLGKKLSQYLSINTYDLDDIFWDQDANTYGIKASVDRRDQDLQNILVRPSWIIEGVYYKWLDESFSNAEAIIFIIPSNTIRNYRIIKRYINRCLGIVISKKETFRSFLKLISWGQSYSKQTIPHILEITEKYKTKRFIFSNADDALAFLTKTPDIN